MAFFLLALFCFHQGFPRRCLLSNCYLKKPKLFYSHDELNKHLQRCMPKADKLEASPRSPGSQPKRQSTRVTTVPLRVCLGYQTTPPTTHRVANRVSTSSVTSSTDDTSNADQSYSSGTSYCSGARGGCVGGICGDGTGGAGGAGASTSNGRADSQAGEAMNADGSASHDHGERRTLSWRSANGGTAAHERLQWSASLSVGNGEAGALLAGNGRLARKAKAGTYGTGAAAGGGSPAGGGSSRRRPSPTGAVARARTFPPAAGNGNAGGGATTPAGGAVGLMRAVVKQEPVPDESSAIEALAAVAEQVSGGGYSGGARAARDGGARAVRGDSVGGDGEDEVIVSPTGVKPTGWRGSLGAWSPSGAFTCPVNPVKGWGIPGCGKENRARGIKCDTCHRCLRVDWQVG